MRRTWIASLIALGLAGCGGMSDAERFSLTTPGSDDVLVREIEGSAKPPPKKPTRAELKVIRGWADALRNGRMERAASFFALPSHVHDGINQLDLPDRGAVRKFNRALPCGAQLLEAVRGEGWFVRATFKLTERIGPRPRPCTGVGEVEVAVFLIEKRHIVQWLLQPRSVQRPAGDAETS